MPIADKSTELSEQVLESVKSGQQVALEAVRKFAETVDKSLPLHGEGPSKRQKVVDAAFEMADCLVQTQYDFLRSVVRSAGKAPAPGRPRRTRSRSLIHPMPRQVAPSYP